MDNFFFKGGGPLNGGEGAEIFGRGGVHHGGHHGIIASNQEIYELCK